MLIHLTLGLLIATISSCFQPAQLSVDEILDQVEKANISSVTATVSYTRTDPILDRREIRTGKILFRINDEKNKEAAILFDTLIIGRRREEKRKHYVFSGRWMAEVDYDNKQFMKRELIAPTEEAIDPFELGNGPIPLPIGQSKESVLSKYDVSLINKPEEGPLSKLEEDVVGLHLIPKKQNEFESIDLFYNTNSWLPIGVRTIETDGTTRVSRLTNVQTNALDEEEIQLLDISTPDPKEWSIDIRPWSD